jgi:hypothetical protein
LETNALGADPAHLAQGEIELRQISRYAPRLIEAVRIDHVAPFFDVVGRRLELAAREQTQRLAAVSDDTFEGPELSLACEEQITDLGRTLPAFQKREQPDSANQSFASQRVRGKTPCQLLEARKRRFSITRLLVGDGCLEQRVRRELTVRVQSEYSVELGGSSSSAAGVQLGGGAIVKVIDAGCVVLRDHRAGQHDVFRASSPRRSRRCGWGCRLRRAAERGQCAESAAKHH